MFKDVGIILNRVVSRKLPKLKVVKGFRIKVEIQMQASVRPPQSPSQERMSYVCLLMICFCVPKFSSMLVNLKIPSVFTDGCVLQELGF